MRALITNDDGIDSIGISALAQVAVEAGLEVTVAAPHEERSGSSAALSALEEGGRLCTEDRRLEHLDGVRAIAVHASPALIVFVGVRGAFGDPPEIVLSGINNGPNTGQAVLHSGTVGAAMTAVTQGRPALAVSLATSAPTHWDTATRAAERALKWFLAQELTPYVLNVNIPDIPAARLRGLRRASLAPFGAVQAHIRERGQGQVIMTFSEVNAEALAGTDVALLRGGWATATALCVPCETTTIDLSTLA